ncbi:MAG: M14 family zinc carboxypeptidase [Verrucomicrobiota bacterium]
MPGGDPQRGWPCWWYFRVDGLGKDERLTLSLTGSDRPARNSGKDTGKPLASGWAMPARAAFSTDGKTWQHTAPGKREGAAIRYEVTGAAGPLWVAWGPPFTPRDTDAMLAEATKRLPAAKSFELAKTREGRSVRGLHVNESKGPNVPAIWVHARQHAWESGASWVARGFVEWLTSDDQDARWLRSQAEIFIVPIMDVDNVATGNGGKEAAPRDHNRDWDEKPVYPEVAAAQQRLREFTMAQRLALFIDLHNPAPGDARPFFFVGPDELLPEPARTNRGKFLSLAQAHINGPLPVEAKPRVTGPGYHPLWRQISGQWVNANGNPHTVAVCLETSWNTPNSTTDGYRTVGRQLGLTVAEYFRPTKSQP